MTERQPVTDIANLDFPASCGSNACRVNPNPARFAVTWAKHLQPSLGHGVFLLCDSCWTQGVFVMSQCESGVIWRIVEVLR